MPWQELNQNLPKLSEREREVVELLAVGATANEIARALILSFHTVRTHIRNVYTKLGVCNRVELMRYLVAVPDTSRTSFPAPQPAISARTRRLRR